MTDQQNNGGNKGMFSSLEEGVKGGLERFRRFSGRVAPRVRESMDQRLNTLGEWVDDWNRRLAERAVPPERRERIRNRGRDLRSRLKVVSSNDREGESGGNEP